MSASSRSTTAGVSVMLCGSGVLDHVRRVARTGNRHDDRIPRQDPRQRQLRPRTAHLAGYPPVRVEQLAVSAVVLRVRTVASRVGCRASRARRGSRSAPHRKPRASGLKATNAMPSSRQASSTAISGLRVQSEYSLWIAATGCTACALRKRRGGYLRKADGPDLSLPHQIRKRADALLDGHVPIHPMEVVEIDDVGLQAFQAVVARPPQRARDGRRSPASPLSSLKIPHLLASTTSVPVGLETCGRRAPRWRRSHRAPPCRTA